LRSASYADGRSKLGYGHSGPADRGLAGLDILETACYEDLAQQVSKRYVPSSLERQVYAPLDEFVFSCGQGGVEAGEIPSFDAAAKIREESLEPWVAGQQPSSR
jgi:hypothetical protein